MALSRRQFVQTAGIGAGAALTSSVWGRGRENSVWSAFEAELQAVEKGMICIASNENPVGPGKKVLDSLHALLEGGTKPGRYSNQARRAHRGDLRALQGQARERAAQRRVDRDPPRRDAGVHLEDQAARRHHSDLRGMRRLRGVDRQPGARRQAELRVQDRSRPDARRRQRAPAWCSTATRTTRPPPTSAPRRRATSSRS